MKRAGTKEPASQIVCAAALRYGQLDFVAHALLAVARKAEHLPLLVAELAYQAEVQHNQSALVRMAAFFGGVHGVHVCFAFGSCS